MEKLALEIVKIMNKKYLKSYLIPDPITFFYLMKVVTILIVKIIKNIKKQAHLKFARAEPAWLRQSVAQVFTRRWTGLAAVAAQRAFADTLLHLPQGADVHIDGHSPCTDDVLNDARWHFPVPDSRVA